MRSNILAFSIMALSGFFAVTIRAEDWWYVVYYPDPNGGFQLLDSNKAKVVTTRQPSIEYVDSGKDRGMRWKFLPGAQKDSFIATQAHQDHIVGYDSGDNEFHADFRKSNDGSAVMAHFINENQLTLCFDSNCIGGRGVKTEEKFVWNYTQIGEA
ncbi:hypothetical protein ACEPAH_4282 [Sanghuangporus vaninii]